MSDGKREERRGLDIDWDAFEDQIDREIDSLFVPAEASAEPSTGSGVVSEEDKPAKGSPVPVAEPPGGFRQDEGERTGIDLRALEMEVDREIDNVFVPVEAFPSSAAVLPASGTVLEGAQKTGSSSPGRETTTKDAPAASAAFSGEPQSSPVKEDTESLPSLIEVLNVAYLSLDWECSAQNIAAMDSSLVRLEPFCAGSISLRNLYKILRSVLQRMKTRPSEIDGRLLDMVRDGYNLLRVLLVSESSPTPGQVEGLKSLISRFQTLKSGPQQPPSAPDKTVPPTKPSAPPAVGTAHSDGPVPAGMTPETCSLGGLRNWLEVYGAQAAEAALGMEVENKLLTHMEEMLGKTPSLAPLMTRVGRIRSNLERHIVFFKTRGEEWSGRMETLREIESSLDRHAPSESGSRPFSPELPQTVMAKRENDALPQRRALSAVICIVMMSGRPIAVPASGVVRIAPVSFKKADRIHAQGYARLSDFKPMFKGVKTGVFGLWGELSENTLLDFRFMYIRTLPGEGGEVVPRKGGAFLLSNGRDHGILIADGSEFEIRCREEIVSAEEKTGEGVAECWTFPDGKVIDVLDLDGVLTSARREEV